MNIFKGFYHRFKSGAKVSVAPVKEYTHLVTDKEVVFDEWRKQWPRNCPVIERTADGINVGLCWFHLTEGVCPRHGQIYDIKKEE